MNDRDYAKLLLESSFKESNTFWIRNGGFYVAQSLLLGLAVGKESRIETIILIAVLGVLLAILHLGVLRISRYYNRTWFKAFCSWVNRRAQQESIENTSPNHQPLNSWSHLRDTLNTYNKLPFPHMTTTALTYFVPFLFMLAWIVLVGALWLERPCLALNSGS